MIITKAWESKSKSLLKMSIKSKYILGQKIKVKDEDKVYIHPLGIF